MNIIYRITNKINNKIYIGATTNKINERWNYHMGCVRRNVQRPLYKAINKYGKENFIIEQIDTAIDEAELSNKEIHYIKQYNSFIGWKNSQGYNCTEGGQDFFKLSHKECERRSIRMMGKKLSEETKRKISETKKKNPWVPTQEYRELQRKLSTGRFHTPETTAKIVAKTTGMKRTDEQKEKMRQAALGRKRSELSKIKTGETLKNNYLDRLHPFKLFKDGIYIGTFIKQTDFLKPNTITKYAYLNNIINGIVKPYNKNLSVEFLDISVEEFLKNNKSTPVI